MFQNKNRAFIKAAQLIRDAHRIVCFTGAGVCTDSGIPDYRGVTGSQYWKKFNLKDFGFGQFIASEPSRKEYWRMDQEFYELVKRSLPNQTHYALADLERLGKLSAIITQNVDGLHQKAGMPPEKVIEIHGNIFSVTCLQCLKKYTREEIYHRIESGVEAPYCLFCYGILKTDTVLFGQPMPHAESTRSLAAALQSDLFVVIGSSLLVQPASYLIVKAKEAGAKVMIINLTSTPYDTLADLVIYDNAEKAMIEIMEDLIKNLRL